MTKQDIKETVHIAVMIPLFFLAGGLAILLPVMLAVLILELAGVPASIESTIPWEWIGGFGGLIMLARVIQAGTFARIFRS